MPSLRLQPPPQCPWPPRYDKPPKSGRSRLIDSRGQLQGQLKELRAAYEQKTEDRARANGTIYIFQEQIRLLRQAAQPTSSVVQAFATLTGGNLLTHREMGSHIRRPFVSDPSTMLTTTPEG